MRSVFFQEFFVWLSAENVGSDDGKRYGIAIEWAGA